MCPGRESQSKESKPRSMSIGESISYLHTWGRKTAFVLIMTGEGRVREI